MRGRPSLRRFLASLHRWLGLGIGALVAFVGLTGSAVVFHPEVDRWLNPDLFFVQPAQQHATLDTIVETARAAYPGKPPVFVLVRLPPSPDRSYSALLKDGFGKDSGPFFEAFLDPATGTLLGGRAAEDRLFGILIGLHAHLLVGDHSPGETLVGFMGLALILFCATGLYLWWPRRSGFMAALTIRRTHGSYWFNYDLHKATGAIVALPLILSGLTGLFIVFPGYMKPPLQKIIEAPPPPKAPQSRLADATPISADRALALAHAAVPGARATTIQIPSGPQGAFQVRLRHPDDIVQHYSNGATIAHLDRYSGEVLQLHHAAQRTVGSRLLYEWMFPTHTGEIAGQAGRWVLFFGGLAPSVLLGTGVFVWLRRRRVRAARQMRGLAG